jgi:hypothetical protein
MPARCNNLPCKWCVCVDVRYIVDVGRLSRSHRRHQSLRRDIRHITLSCLNTIVDRHQIKFAEVLTDNDTEMGPRDSKIKSQYLLERMLMGLGI